MVKPISLPDSLNIFMGILIIGCLNIPPRLNYFRNDTFSLLDFILV